MRTMAICLAALLYTCPACPATKYSQEVPRRRIIIFDDVTLSLAPDESNSVQAIVNEIFQKAPSGTEIVVIPICENTEGAPHKRYSIPFPGGTSAFSDETVKKERGRLAADAAAFVRDVRDKTNAGKKQYASCISPSLRRLTSLMQPVGGSHVKWTTDVVFVSDMVEECRTSILGRPVRLKLEHNQFKDAKKLVAETHPLPPLPAANIFVIIPEALSTAEASEDRPTPAELEDFWKRLFARSGVPSNRLYWNIDPTEYASSIGE